MVASNEIGSFTECYAASKRIVSRKAGSADGLSKPGDSLRHQKEIPAFAAVGAGVGVDLKRAAQK
jgi:hypothetical protein